MASSSTRRAPRGLGSGSRVCRYRELSAEGGARRERLQRPIQPCRSTIPSAGHATQEGWTEFRQPSSAAYGVGAPLSRGVASLTAGQRERRLAGCLFVGPKQSPQTLTIRRSALCGALRTNAGLPRGPA